MQTLTIGLIAPGYATPDDPGLPSITDLASRLAIDHAIRLVSLRYPATGDPYQLSGVTVHPLGGGTAGGPADRVRLLGRAIARIRDLHLERPFDVLHAMWADEAGAAAVIAGRLIGRPVVVSVLGGELVALPDIRYGTALGRGGRWTTRIALRGADLVTVGSSTLRDVVAARVPDDRLALLPLGVDPSTFSPGSPTTTAPRRTVLHVASLEPVKDQVTLLRAFARVAGTHRDVRLVICGDGSRRRALQRLAVQLAIDDAVDFRGHVSRDRLPALYRAATLLAVSSRWEAQSMAAVEAAACAVPVVGTRVGCLTDLAEGALTVPIGEHIALAAAIRAVLDDTDLSARMGEAGRAAAVARYDVRDTARTLSDLYAQLPLG